MAIRGTWPQNDQNPEYLWVSSVQSETSQTKNITNNHGRLKLHCLWSFFNWSSLFVFIKARVVCWYQNYLDILKCNISPWLIMHMIMTKHFFASVFGHACYKTYIHGLLLVTNQHEFAEKMAKGHYTNNGWVVCKQIWLLKAHLTWKHFSANSRQLWHG